MENFYPEHEEEIDDRFPPISPLTQVVTTHPNPEFQEEISRELWYGRRWGIFGIVLSDAKEKIGWHEVLHEQTGLVSFYHCTELNIRNDSEEDNDDDSGDDDFDFDPTGPIPENDCIENSNAEESLLELVSA